MADEIRRLSDDLARDPSSLVFMRLADALRRAGQLDLAMRVALRGLDRHPYVADAHDVLARIHADRGDLDRASDEWEMALRLDPSHEQARLGLGFIDFRRGDLESAERRLSAAGGGEPGVVTALAHVRSALAARGAEVPVQDATFETPVDSASNGVAPSESSGGAGGANPLVHRFGNDAANGAGVPSTPNDSRFGRATSDAGRAPATASHSVVEYPRPDASCARELFVPVLEGAGQTAVLVDGQGLVIAGSYVDARGNDVADVVAAELAGVSSEAERAMRHLGLGAWTSLLVEADHAVVAMTPAPMGSLMVVAASRETPVGLVRLLLDRALTRARDWLARVS
jgi:predicted regulator of Ras-like GTPase activity (Roadblock/LC7/MglB family)